MAQTGPIHGTGGKATLAAPYDTVLNIFEWSGNIKSDEYPSDTFSAASLGHSFYHGRHQFRGKLRAYLDGTTNIDATMVLPGRTAAAISLEARQGTQDLAILFSGHLNNFAIVVDAQTGLNALEADVISTTAVTETTYTA